MFRLALFLIVLFIGSHLGVAQRGGNSLLTPRPPQAGNRGGATVFIPGSSFPFGRKLLQFDCDGAASSISDSQLRRAETDVASRLASFCDVKSTYVEVSAGLLCTNPDAPADTLGLIYDISVYNVDAAQVDTCAQTNSQVMSCLDTLLADSGDVTPIVPGGRVLKRSYTTSSVNVEDVPDVVCPDQQESSGSASASATAGAFGGFTSTMTSTSTNVGTG